MEELRSQVKVSYHKCAEIQAFYGNSVDFTWVLGILPLARQIYVIKLERPGFYEVLPHQNWA